MFAIFVHVAEHPPTTQNHVAAKKNLRATQYLPISHMLKHHPTNTKSTFFFRKSRSTNNHRRIYALNSSLRHSHCVSFCLQPVRSTASGVVGGFARARSRCNFMSIGTFASSHFVLIDLYRYDGVWFAMAYTAENVEPSSAPVPSMAYP